MLGVTFFGVFLTPVFYYVIQRFAPAKPAAAAGEGEAASPLPPGGDGGAAPESGSVAEPIRVPPSDEADWTHGLKGAVSRSRNEDDGKSSGSQPPG